MNLQLQTSVPQPLRHSLPEDPPKITLVFVGVTVRLVIPPPASGPAVRTAAIRSINLNQSNNHSPNSFACCLAYSAIGQAPRASWIQVMYCALYVFMVPSQSVMTIGLEAEPECRVDSKATVAFTSSVDLSEFQSGVKNLHTVVEGHQ